MAVLGFRCSNTDFAYCVLSGGKAAPVVEQAQLVSYPAGFSEPEVLKWLHQELAQIFGRYVCDTVAIKKPELSVSRSNALDTRIECEGIVILAAAEAGCLSATRVLNVSIAKGLGLKGKAKYLKTLDTSPISGFDGYPAKVKESIVTGWSAM